MADRRQGTRFEAGGDLQGSGRWGNQNHSNRTAEKGFDKMAQRKARARARSVSRFIINQFSRGSAKKLPSRVSANPAREIVAMSDLLQRTSIRHRYRNGIIRQRKTPPRRSSFARGITKLEFFEARRIHRRGRP